MSLRRTCLAIAVIALVHSAPAVAGEAAPPASPAPAEAKIGGHDEAWWRKKTGEYREKLAKAEQHVAECEKKADANRLDSGLRPLDACASQTWSVERAEDHLADFDADARAQRVPPAWIR
jgi:hypothetical protein